MSDFDIIDPPVTPYSSVKEINAWISDLKKREQSQSIDDAIAEAKDWLEMKNDASE